MSKHTRSGEIRDFNKRDRSDSLDRVFNAAGSQNSPSGLNPLWEDAPDALASSIEQMHLLNQKKLRDGPGPNSYKQNDGDIFDAYFTGNEGSGTLDSDGMAGSLGFDDGLQFGSHSDIDGSFGGRGKAGLDGGFFAMDDLGGSEQALSNSFKESMTFAKTEPEDSMPSFMSPPSQATETVPTRTSNKKKPAANSAAGALSASTGASEKISPAKSTGGNKAASAAAMLGGHPPSSAAMAAAMPPASAALATPSIAEEGTERLSHKEVEQRRREKAKQYFDELRALLPCGADSKFDKNTILQNTIAMIKQLQAELENYREIKMGGKRPPTQPASHDFKNSFDVTRQPLCFCGLDGSVWESNSAFCSLLGYSKQEIQGVSLLHSTAACDSDASNQHWQRLISSGMCNCAFYCHLIRKDQQQLLVNMDLNLIHKRNQPFCFLVATNPTQ